MAMSRKRSPSYLLTRGRIVAMDDAHCVHQAILLRDGLVAWVGDSSDAPAADIRIDLQGATVIPGLTDAHLHLLAVAQESLQVRLDGPGIRSIDDVARALAAAAAASSAGDWVVASGFDESRLPTNRLLDVDDLDAIVPDRPLVVRRFCGHLAIANSKALQAAGLSADTPDPPGGERERRDGRLTGVLRELAADHMYGIAPKPSAERLGERIREVARDYLAHGVTSFCEAAVGFTNGFDDEWPVWQRLRKQGEFPLRACFMLRLNPDEAALRGIVPGEVDPDWQVRTLKFFADGIVGARTAAFSQPYRDCPGCGTYVTAPADLRRRFVDAHEAGWQIAVHAIGDAAIDQVLDAFEAALARTGRLDRRHRIEHLGFPAAGAIARLARSGLSVVTQYGFLYKMGDSFIRAVGADRGGAMYFGKSLLEAGLTVAGSSDGPTGPRSPFVAMMAAMQRRTEAGVAVAPNEAMSAQQALRIYCQGGAHCVHQEGMRGTLKPGYLADLAILDTDILSASPEEIMRAKAIRTFVRGVPVFG